ncbi:M12 family metallo-peptidase [Dokdonella immobilis]|uniref:Metallo-peptidase family M12 n=1 Tax=Dokdonella immobilis TaxID=578942 RepID=A0A1I5AVP7_9GAMM|nr:M12 family metallo-peptidase [Dokdonella immobilis]SFN66596.1 Metallo-peptidase family M12 [Dokdonella immobilis]
MRTFPGPALSILLVFLSTTGLCASPVAPRAQLLGHASASARAILLPARASGLETVALSFTPLKVFTDDAELIIVDQDGHAHLSELPDTRFYRVAAANAPGLAGVLAVADAGNIFGLVRSGTEFSQLRFAPDGQLTLDRIDMGAVPARDFRCANDHSASGMSMDATGMLGHVMPAEPDPAAASAAYTARIAIETDTEFLGRFSGNTTNATSYVGGLIGFTSTIYDAQVQTNMQVSFLRLWTSPDPYVESTPECLLLESGNYWNANQTSTSRTTMHFLSGKTTTAGIAWIGVLCRGAFTTSQSAVGASCSSLAASGSFGGGYGVTEGISGSFNPGSPSVVWDVAGVAHEIGHNFNSPHTHCYGGIGGSPDPVDQCYASESGCYAGTPSLPGPQGQGSGTIMSYCQLRAGGFSNVALTLGAGHPFGVLPGRVPSRMFAHVQSQAGSNPGCLALQAIDLIFANGFD